MPLVHDIIRQAGIRHVQRGHAIDKPEEKEILKQYFIEMGLDEESIHDSLHAIAPECLSVATGVWWLTLMHPTRLCVYPDRIVYIRRFLWFHRFLRCERAVMMRHIREVEINYYLFSATLTFRTHRSVEVFHVKKLYKKHSRIATRIVQAMIHNELNHGSVPSGDDFT